MAGHEEVVKELLAKGASAKAPGSAVLQQRKGVDVDGDVGMVGLGWLMLMLSLFKFI